uniref:Fe2OG dioxygenase domain-containing protein n=1 Tax=Amphimedon queenslandica TaxID=400682 RepID=A0A1X7TKU4_AMPQE
MVQKLYQRLDPPLYTLDESYFHSDFLRITKYCRDELSPTMEGLLQMISKEEASQVYSFPVFTDEFCRHFLDELDHFERSDLPKGCPNTMNNTGILLAELGFDDHFMNRFKEHYLQPLSALLYPEWTGSSGLDSHRSHIVTYDATGPTDRTDVGLSTHFDNAEVTLNVSLGKEYSDGELYFGEMKGVVVSNPRLYPYYHKIGRGVIHRGQHMHGAMDITDGTRYNIIVWMRSSSVRNKLCPRCDQSPTLIPFEGYGDGFTKQ